MKGGVNNTISSELGILTGSGSIVNKRLPDLYRRLTNNVDRILPCKVKRRENPITTVQAENIHERLPRRLRGSVLDRLFLVIVNIRLATDTRNLEQ